MQLRSQGTTHGFCPILLHTVLLSHRLKSAQYARWGIKQMKNLLAIVFLLSFGLPAQAQMPPVYGFGATQCSTYLNDLRLRGDSARQPYYSWTQGFISAANALLQDTGMVADLTAKINQDDQQKILEALCRVKPDQEFSRAAMQLLDKIRTAEGLQPILR
jgi:hypothetical protein